MAKKKLKVLILSHSSELGGAEMSMIDLFDYWYKKGLIEPHFIIRRPLSVMVPELKKRGWGYSTLHYTNWSQRNPSKNPESIYRNARINSEATKNIEEIIKKVKPDVVMTNTVVSPWAALAAYFQGIPHVWFVREYGDIDHQHVFELGREKLYQDIDSLSNLVVTNSQTLADHVSKYISSSKIQPVYTPFDIPGLEKKSKTAVTSPYNFPDSLKLVMTGRIAPSKGQDEAAEAVGRLNKQGLNTELCIIGESSDPRDEDTLKAVIKKYDIADKVHLVGRQPNPTTLGIIKLADVGVMASQKEAFGRVTFEYLAMGRPVVGANSGATPELVDDGKCGFLYTKGQPETLTKAILKYAKDKKLAAKHGEAAKVKTRSMMAGKYSADKLFAEIQSKIKDGKSYPQRPINFLHKIVDLPEVVDKYIKDSNSMSFKRLTYNRVKGRLRPAVIKYDRLGLATKSVNLAKTIRSRKKTATSKVSNTAVNTEITDYPPKVGQPSPVTVVVPVYGDWSSLKVCIQSLKDNLDTSKHNVILVNDCGPKADTMESNIKKMIKGVKGFAYYRNPQNLGFGLTCNRAVMELDKTNNDIILLNSDAAITPGAIEELQAALHSQEDLGAVSPRSNNATICTMPLSAINEHGIDKDKSYAMFKKHKDNFPQVTQVPTAHGFCILLYRPLIKKYGLFDAAFGRGYGEEVDFCQRIRAKGKTCGIANHAFVFHLEARSFSIETKNQLLEENNKIIRARYPGYQREVSEYIKRAKEIEAAILSKKS